MAVPPDVNKISGASVSVEFGLFDTPHVPSEVIDVANYKFTPMRRFKITDVSDVSKQMFALRFTLSGQIRNSAPLCYKILWTAPNGAKQTDSGGCHPPPQTAGYEWWNWIKYGMRLGGINPPIPLGVYSIVIQFATGNVVSGTYQFFFEVYDPDAAPVEEYKKLPVPPADFPAVFLPTYKLLDEALANNDKAEVLRILKEHHLDEGSPITFIAILLFLKASIPAILGVIGSFAFASFLFEETLQTLDITIYQAQQKKEWDLAQKAIAKKEEVLEQGRIANFLDAIPVVNVITAVNKFIDASRFKLEIDKELIQRQVSNVEPPKPGDFQNYVNALDTGNEPSAFEPPAFGILKINVNAPYGAVEWNGSGMSTLFPTELSTIAGEYDFIVSAEGKEPLTQRISVEPYVSKEVSFNLADAAPSIPGEKGRFNITSNPSGAQIFINFVDTGKKSNTSVEVAPGVHTITLKKVGYQDRSITKAIKANETINVNILLPVKETPIPEPEPEPGTAPEEELVIPLEPGAPPYNAWKVTIKGVDSVTGEELAAWILINDTFMGKTTPYFFFLQPEAAYNVKLRLKGYKQGEVDFVTKPLPST